MLLQRVYDLFTYIRGKLFGLVFEKSYSPVPENDYLNSNGNDNETQCVVFFDAENGIMYNKL